MLDEYEIHFAEISDGAINITHEEKCNYIRMLSTERTIVSEIGSKDKDKVKIIRHVKKSLVIDGNQMMMG